MVVVTVGGVDVSYEETLSGASVVRNVLERFDGVAQDNFADLHAGPGPGLQLVFDRDEFVEITGRPLPDNRAGMTSNWLMISS